MHCKKSFAIFSALLVGFSCLSLVCFTKAWADEQEIYGDTLNTTTQDYFCAFYAVDHAFDPVYNGNAMYIPTAIKRPLYSLGTSNDWTVARTFNCSSNIFKPLDHQVYLYITLGVDCDGWADCTGTSSKTETLYYQKNETGYVSGGIQLAKGVEYKSWTKASEHNQSGIFKVTVPAGCSQFRFYTPATFKWKGTAMISSYGAWVVDPQNVDKFEEVLDILIDMEADLDTQTEILNVVSSRLNTISGNVQNIYNLLYDSLHDESSELSSESEAVAEQIMQREDSEQYWNDKNMENYQAIGLDNFTFSSGIVSGISLVGTIFTNLWNALGDYTVIFTFSLTLGVALVVIGRVSRTGGKKDGDDG